MPAQTHLEHQVAGVLAEIKDSKYAKGFENGTQVNRRGQLQAWAHAAPGQRAQQQDGGQVLQAGETGGAMGGLGR